MLVKQTRFERFKEKFKIICAIISARQYFVSTSRQHATAKNMASSACSCWSSDLICPLFFKAVEAMSKKMRFDTENEFKLTASQYLSKEELIKDFEFGTMVFLNKGTFRFGDSIRMKNASEESSFKLRKDLLEQNDERCIEVAKWRQEKKNFITRKEFDDILDIWIKEFKEKVLPVLEKKEGTAEDVPSFYSKYYVFNEENARQFGDDDEFKDNDFLKKVDNNY